MSRRPAPPIIVAPPPARRARPGVAIPPPPAISADHRRRLDRVARTAGAAGYVLPLLGDHGVREVMHFPAELPHVIIPPVMNLNESNFYILPFDVLEFLHHFPGLVTGRRDAILNIPELTTVLNGIRPPTVPPLPQPYFPPEDRIINRVGFVTNEYRKLTGGMSRNTMFPYLTRDGK